MAPAAAATRPTDERKRRIWPLLGPAFVAALIIGLNGHLFVGLVPG
jgi:hypothetical protein